MAFPCHFLNLSYSYFMTIEIITAWAAIIAALAAAAGVFVASKSRKDFRLSLAADLSMKLDDRFNSDEFKKARSTAAKALLSGQDLGEAEDVFDFFETIGLFVQTSALTPEFAHNFFFHWINLYWNAGKNYIDQKRQDARPLWEDFEFIYNAVLKIEKRKDPNSKDLRSSEERIREQLQEEAALEDT